MGEYELKRLGIFSIYDPDGIIDEYIEYILHELKMVVNDLIIVVNGKLKWQYVGKLKRISEAVIYRHNQGFDGGAFKEVLVNYVKKEHMHQYDELVLCNDTCFGPFISFRSIWEEMDTKVADFWGMNYIDNGLTNHMQGYFIVFRKTLIENDMVYSYFCDSIDDNCMDIQEIIATYEKGLWKYLIEKGFSFESYVECNNLDMYRYGNVLIRKYGFPFLKKKCFNPRYNNSEENMIDSLKWISENTDYDVKMIKKSCQRLYKIKLDLEKINEIKYLPIVEPVAEYFAVSRNELEKFIEDATDIYIYGCGKYGKEIYFLYLRGNNKFRGFVVSDGKESGNAVLYNYSIKTISEIEMSASIIVAMNYVNRREVVSYIKQKRVIYIL